MDKQKKIQEAQRQGLTGLERLGLRVSAMIGSPVAQIQRWVTIHRLDNDSDQDWQAIMELLAEIDRLDMTFCDDGSVILQWDKPTEDDWMAEREGSVEAVEQAPF
ncbi:DUF1654 domain-containing protein [Pseudomonas chlororaphis]|uniref:DUF1654 domain-containing protein n=1 Tax=Pseudomonas chlororaphis TaxID=587753 RepID=UPI0019262BE8|nr:DUF1654 domain-containing protein [Pseudomonas chlororaphis]QQX60914.1 DUF1654 domain-containing protein [Pseudomonas chlororaphis subsp. aurantiaca]